jgi:pimeloyl-ACP methyl ester carboxylesterase
VTEASAALGPSVADAAPERIAVEVPGVTLEDLDHRLRRARFPADIANEDWRYGANRAALEELVTYWREEYSWSKQAGLLNAHPHFRVWLDGIPIHYMHIVGQGPAPLPIILTHGWPWTFWDWKDVIGPLTDPAVHGGDAADAFTIVVPSLPGYGLSTPLTTAGVNFWTTADLWVRLMTEVLGFDRFAASGGDWGNLVTAQLGHKYADRLIGIHICGRGAHPGMWVRERPWDPWGDALSRLPDAYRRPFIEYHAPWASHVAVQTRDPQTLAYAMHDSPVGLAAWLLERRRAWSDCDGDVENVFSKDFLITTFMLYWATDAFVSSVRYYAEAWRNPWRPTHDRIPLIEAPTGMTVFLREVPPTPPEQLERYFREVYGSVIHLDEQDRGGHFSPAERPEAIVDGIRATFRSLRGGWVAR